VRALLAERLYVAGEDIRNVALDALRHRLLLNFDAEAERITTDDIIADIVQRVALPA
jgi:MoxR-like ATPase